MRHHFKILLLISIGCAGNSDSLGEDAETAATATGATADAAEVSAWFTSFRGLEDPGSGATVEEARAVVIAAAEEAIAGAMMPPACVAIETDEVTYLEATMTGCTGPGGRAGMSGVVRGELDFETRPCGPVECPTAVLWSVTATIVGDDGGELEGAWLITAPVESGEPHAFDGAITATGPWGREVATEVAATWNGDDDGCVSLDASASIDGAALTIEGLVRCPGVCPAAGTIAFTSPGGGIAWSYDGTAQVTVTGEGGGSVELPLHCAP